MSATVGFLIFAGVIVMVIGGLLGGSLWLRRTKAPLTSVVLLATAHGEAEAHLWAERLRVAGIRCQVRRMGYTMGGDLLSDTGSGPYGFEYEVWVRPGDAERARQVLGL